MDLPLARSASSGASQGAVPGSKLNQLQGLCYTASQPLHAAQRWPATQKLTPLDALGTLVWCMSAHGCGRCHSYCCTGFGLLLECIGDAQRGSVNAGGKRGPLRRAETNLGAHTAMYGSAAVFWGFYIVSLNARGGWTGVYSPLLMNYVTLRLPPDHALLGWQ